MRKLAHQVLIYGVSGSGKSTVGKALADALQCDFVDADDFHTSESIEMMARGQPLTEAQRAPWLARLCQHLTHYSQNNHSIVVAVSGLKRAHRMLLQDACENASTFLLNLPACVLRERLENRASHFFPAELLDSQLSTLEQPSQDEVVVLLDGTQSVTDLVSICRDKLNENVE